MAHQKARCGVCGKKVFHSKGRLVEHHNRKTNARCDGSDMQVEGVIPMK